MPKGQYLHLHKGGRKAECTCGRCPNCRRRKWYAEKLGVPDVSDAELERRLLEKFLKEGWDK